MPHLNVASRFVRCRGYAAFGLADDPMIGSQRVHEFRKLSSDAASMSVRLPALMATISPRFNMRYNVARLKPVRAMAV